MHQKIIDLVIREDEITWKTMLLNLVKEEGLDPWDVNITVLGERFIEMVKTMKEMDLRISGKIILATAILLRLKSEKLLNDDINAFDQLLASSEDQEEFFDELGHHLQDGEMLQRPKDFKLMPRTPQPRKRKVSVYDLVDALQKALEVKRRRIVKPAYEVDIKIPEKKIDITQLMKRLFETITTNFETKPNMMFSELIPDETKEGKVYTFIPLLHLRNQQRIELDQESAFADISISINQENKNKPFEHIED